MAAVTSRRRSPNQLDLFGNPQPAVPAPAPAPVRECPPVRSGKSARSAAGNPAVATDVLAEVRDGRYGLLDDTDRVVVFEDTEQVRLALDEDIVHHLISAGCVERRPPSDTVVCRHGAIRRPVSPLQLTRNGRTLLHRWTAYKPLGANQ